MSLFAKKLVEVTVETPQGPFSTFINPDMVVRISLNPMNANQCVVRLADNQPIVVESCLRALAKKLHFEIC